MNRHPCIVKRVIVLLMLGTLLTLDPGINGSVHASFVLFAAPETHGSGNCSSWENACTLQTALTTATSPAEIWVVQGQHTPGPKREDTFQLKIGVEIYGGFAGKETSREKRNWVTHVTILSGEIGRAGNYDNSYHVVNGSYVDSSAVLDGFTITGGNANGTTPNDRGGGMYNDHGQSTLTNITFSDNSATYGGGMYNTSASNLTLTNGTFDGNLATGDGGGMYTFLSVPTLTNIAFSSNSADGRGGGMFNDQGSAKLTDVTFYNNTAFAGGGMENYNGSNSTLTNVTFSDNSADIGGGGMNNYNSDPTLMGVTFSGNSSDSYGGGMYNKTDSNPSLTNVTFDNNSSTFGGGIYNIDQSHPTLTNVTFRNNSATNTGGGMYNTNLSNPVVENTILWDDSAPDDPEIHNYNSSPIFYSSDVQGCGGSGSWNSVCGSNGGGNIDADPHLGALGDYGGATQTLPLLPGSAAVDAGNDTSCPETDQRGVTRPQGAHCDIGAYEYEYPKIYLPLVRR